MDKSLVIVESPSKAKTINKYLGKNFRVVASVGHIKNLPKSKIGVDFENGFTPTYETIPGKEKVISELKTQAAESSKIYIATDPDREGEAIAYDIANEIKRDSKSIYRVLFNEITRKGIEEGIHNPLQIDERLVSSQQARRVMDRIVGYKLSPFLWKVIYYGLSAGRVQSVALKLICEREEEIRNFTPVEYWSIIAEFKDTDKNKIFQSKLVQKNDAAFKFNGDDPKIKNEKEADEIITDLKSKLFKVSDVQKKEVKRNPYPPFITSSLQQDASVRLRFAPKKTMMLAQKLYEGVDIGEEGLVGLITYMRTDSTRLSEDSISEARKFIAEKFGKEYLPHNARHFARKGQNTQDAHEAIRPTSVYRTPESLRKHLSSDLSKLYELIWNRFTACQMQNAVFNQVTVLIDSSEPSKNGGVSSNFYQFKTTDSTVMFDGFLKLYNVAMENGDKDEERYSISADIEKGDILDLQSLNKNQHFTQPPARYTESSLIKQLDALGIGRPSTYAMIVSTIINRTYVTLEERKLYATELGEAVNRLLSKYFEDIINYEFTAKMEEELDKIAEGEIDYKRVLNDFYTPFNSDLEELNAKTKEIKKSLQEMTDIDCELCGSKMTIKWGRNGRFLSCSNYPKCKNAKPLPGEQQEHEEIAEGKVCSVCGAPMVVKSSKYGKFLGCSRYPECKNIMPITLGIKCPKCGEGEIVERKAQKTRKKFYGCSRYPVNKECDSCGNSYMLEKYSKKKGTYLECPECKHKIIITSDEEQPEVIET
jgi:DNA topoisomerase-1